jgi:leucyl aminopeptidase
VEFSIKALAPDRARCDCVAVAVADGNKLSRDAQVLDRAAGGAIAAVLKRGDLENKAGATLMLYHLPNILAPRVLLYSVGKTAVLKDLREAMRAVARVASAAGVEHLTLYLSTLEGVGEEGQVALAIAATLETTYRYESIKKAAKPAAKKKLAQVTVAAAVNAKTRAALARGIALGEGSNLARQLGNLPANVCTPTYLAKQATLLAREQGLKIKILDEREMARLGMGSFLSVTRGSREPAKFIVMEYHGRTNAQRPVVLVGKGITFDTGGISLKPAAEMDEMKYDMSGAGSVLGTLKACAMMKLPLNVVGIIPTCENMPGGVATKPGDVVTSMSGQTIEILNTDAEGRLILCDALTYAQRYKPELIIDIATLTGACVVALGHVASGLFSNDDKLAQELYEAGEASGDRAWRMPVWEDYQDQLKSNFADMANIGGRPAGSITAACFLARFARDQRWAHLDIAGTAWKSGREKGSTGRPVPLLTHFLMNRAGIR